MFEGGLRFAEKSIDTSHFATRRDITSRSPSVSPETILLEVDGFFLVQFGLLTEEDEHH